MLKNLRRRAPEKDKLGHDLFKFSKLSEHGFPHKPSAIAYDDSLKLLAIGTQNGYLKLFGMPGVELVAQEASSAACIQELHFLNEQGRLISVCDGGETNSLHLWELNIPYGGETLLQEVKACMLEGRLKQISVCCLSRRSDRLYIGTEGGHIYTLDIDKFELREHVIYQDIVMQSLPEGSNKSNGGSVEALKEHPTDHDQLLIGYKKGVIVVWNQDKLTAEQSVIAAQDVENLCWRNGDPTRFASVHDQGTLSVWDLPANDTGDVRQESSTPFGPYPCKAIRKVEWHENTMIFSGGLTRASYGDKHCVTVYEDNKVQVVFDFTSKVIDFLTISDDDGGSTLAVLCEEEIVFIDINDNSYTPLEKPYLACIHSSNITASTTLTDCPQPLWELLHEAGKCQGGQSTKNWPIMGGETLDKDNAHKHLIITGHEDGTVKFWNASGLRLNLVYTITTSKLFHNEDHEGPPPDNEDEEDWPVFTKVGRFDPFADDPRLVIQKLELCPVTNTLVVGGSGGQLVVYTLTQQAFTQKQLQQQEVNIIEHLEGFEWKGLGPMALSATPLNTEKFGPVPKKVLQLKPAAPITAVALDTASGLIAAGTCHGLFVFDVITDNMIMVKCTVNPTDLANTGAGIQRKRTLVKSLRDSFRRLKSRRGSRRQTKRGGAADGTGSPTSPLKSYEVCPQTRLIDENRVDEAVLSMVRCLYFGDTFLGDGQHATTTLWAGTNAGYIYVYSITVPPKTERTKTAIKAEVGKELKLKHHAPVINIFVVDKHGVPLMSKAETEAGRRQTVDMTGGHSVIISSEEQFKIFSLPMLRPRNKEKITAVDGSRVRKLGVMEIQGKNELNEETTHHCLLCLTNQGDISVYSVPHLKQQIKAKVVKKEDISAISSLLFTRYGDGIFLKSPSELQRISMVANPSIKAGCVIKIARGKRPDAPSDDEEYDVMSAGSNG